jgi:hypothetical protein
LIVSDGTVFLPSSVYVVSRTDGVPGLNSFRRQLNPQFY